MTEAGEQTTAQRRTWRKSAHKPKHPLNAYNVFFQFERERILNHQSDSPINIEDVAKIQISQEKKKKRKRVKKQSQQFADGAKVGFADLARTIASKWKQLGDEAKAAFEKHAEQEKIRYKQELEQWAQTEAKGDAGNDTATAAPQLDDGSILSLGTPLPLQMEDEMVHPVSPLMFGAAAKSKMEVPRTIAFEKKRKEKQQQQLSAQASRQATAPVSQSNSNSTGALQEQIATATNPNTVRPSMVTPPQDSGSLEGTPEEQEMRKMLEHHTREMNLIASRLNQMENNRPAMPHNNMGGPTCCAACMSKAASNGNAFQNPNMFQQGHHMGDMGMGMMNMGFMHNNNGMMNPGFNNFGNPAAAGFAWDPVAMQNMGMSAANGFDFPAICFPANGQVNGGAWASSNGPDPKGLNFAVTSGAWESNEEGPRRVSMQSGMQM